MKEKTTLRSHSPLIIHRPKTIPSSPPRSLPKVWNSHWLQSITDMKNLNQTQSLHCFQNSFFFSLEGGRKKTGILWIFQHLISVGDVDGTAQRDSFRELHFLSKTHKQIGLIHSKGQPQPKQRETKRGFGARHGRATPPRKNTSPRVLVKHGEPHECCMAILAVFTLTWFLCLCLRRWQGRRAYALLQQSSGITLLYLLFKSQNSI